MIGFKREEPMTPEEIQRTMEFLLAQQARFDGRLERMLDEMHGVDARLREEDRRLRESQATLTASVLRIAELLEDVTAAQKGTDERLNALINVVEKHITGHNHGRPAS
jgi:hypothetical protein